MRKKLLATVLAASMVLSMAPVLPASTGTVASAEEAATDVATDVIDTVGTKDLSSAFFTQFSKHYLLTQNCDATFTFRNYSNCVNNWENYVMAFTNEAGINNLDKSDANVELAIIRGDAYGWGESTATYTGTDTMDWAAFLEIMKAANVTVNVKRSGDKVTLAVKASAIDDATKSYEWGAEFTTTTADIFLTFTNELSYQEITSVTGAEAVVAQETVGAEDKTAGFWTVFSKPYRIGADNKVTVEFDNYGGVENWNNYFMAFTNDGKPVQDAENPDANHKEYAVVRGDAYGWAVIDGVVTANVSLSGDPITHEGITDFDAFKTIMQDAHVSLTVNRNGKQVDVTAKVVSNTDATQSYEYKCSFVTEETGDVYLSLGVEAAYIKIASAVYGTSDATTTEPTTPSTPSDDVETPAAKKMTVKVTAKKNATKVTGTVSVKKATVKVKVGKKAYKKATVNGKKFTLKCAKLTKGTKVTVKVTKSGYTAVTKTVKVK